MGLPAFKDDFDEMAARLAHAPSRPVGHPILLGVKSPSKAQKVIEKIDAYESNVLGWRTDGLKILHDLRRSLQAAATSDDFEAVQYAVTDTIPGIVDALSSMQISVLQPWEGLDDSASDVGLALADRSFFKYLQKRDRDFGRSVAGKIDHMRDAFLSLAWDFDQAAREVSTQFNSDNDIDAFFSALPHKE